MSHTAMIKLERLNSDRTRLSKAAFNLHPSSIMNSMSNHMKKRKSVAESSPLLKVHHSRSTKVKTIMKKDRDSRLLKDCLLTDFHLGSAEMRININNLQKVLIRPSMLSSTKIDDDSTRY